MTQLSEDLSSLQNISMGLSDSGVAAIEACLALDSTSAKSVLQNGYQEAMRPLWSLVGSSPRSSKTMTVIARMIQRLFNHTHPGRCVRLAPDPRGLFRWRFSRLRSYEP